MRLLLTYFLLCVCSFGQVLFTNNAANQFIDFQHDDIYNTGGSNFTITAWINPKQTTWNTYGTIIGKMSPASAFPTYYLRYGKVFGTNVVSFATYNSGYGPVCEQTLVPDGNWHFVAGVMFNAGTGCTVYVDGVRGTNGAGTFKNSDNTNDVFVGSHWIGSNKPFDGGIDDARIYKRVLSDEEILDIYNRPWELADDVSLVVRSSAQLDDTGTTLSGTAYNYGTGANGAYSNSPKAAAGLIQHDKPRRVTYYPGFTDIVLDSSGNENNATNYGATISETATGWKADFDGINDYMSMGYLGLSNEISAVVCIENVTLDTFDAIIGRWNSTANRRSWNLNRSSSPNAILAQVSESGLTSSSYVYRSFDIQPDLIATGRHVLGFTYSGTGTLELYHNGVTNNGSLVLAAAPFPTYAYQAPQDFDEIMSRNSASSPTYSEGTVHWIRIYKQLLSDSDHAALANGIDITNVPVAYYRMNPLFK